MNEEGPIADAAEAWIDWVVDFERTFKVSPQEGHCLVNSCIECGYNYQHSGLFMMWLVEKCAELIEEYEKNGFEIEKFGFLSEQE